MPNRPGVSDKSDRTPPEDKLIESLDALKEAVETAIPNGIAAILDGKLAPDASSTAAWRIHRMAVVIVSALGALAKQEPALLRPIAETSEAWPAFISPHHDYARSNLELIERLGVGEKHFLRLKFPKGKRGKRWSVRKLANFIAVQLIKGLGVLQIAYRSQERDLRDKKLREIKKKYGLERPEPSKPMHSKKLRNQILRLPPTSAETINRWFDAGWNILLEETRGRPETNPMLRALGNYRRNHTEQSPQGTKASESNIRDGIKERLRAAFSTVVRQSAQN